MGRVVRFTYALEWPLPDRAGATAKSLTTAAAQVDSYLRFHIEADE
jgi:hypothetical protein